MSFSVIHCAILPIMMVTVEGTRLIRYYLAVRNVMNIPCPSIKSFTVCQALNRVRSAVELDSFTNVEPYLKHSTSAIDTTSCFYQVGKISTRKKKVGGGSGKVWTQLSLSFFCGCQTYCMANRGGIKSDTIKSRTDSVIQPGRMSFNDPVTSV